MSRASRGFRIFGFLIKFSATLVVASVCGLLLWRVFSSKTPRSLTNISVNDAVYDAYSDDKELYIFSQEQNSMTRAENNLGYFSVTHTAFIPEANQIQVVLRYNNSTIKHLVEDKALSSVPSRNDNLFDVNLFFSVDITPDNKDDNAIISEESTRTFRCSSELVMSEPKNLYNYRKFVFDLDTCGEDLKELLDSELLLAVYADVYYVEDMDLNEKAYGTLCLYDYVTDIEEVKLSSAEKKSVIAWKAKD